MYTFLYFQLIKSAKRKYDDLQGIKNVQKDIMKSIQNIESQKPGSLKAIKVAYESTWGEVAVPQFNKANMHTEIIEGAKDSIVSKIKGENLKKVSKRLLKALGLRKLAKLYKPLEEKWIAMVAKYAKTAAGIAVIFEAVGIAFSAYEIAVGVKNLQGSGTITDILEKSAVKIDVATFQTLQLYEDITGTEIQDIDFANEDYKMTGLQLHTCNKVNSSV